MADKIIKGVAVTYDDVQLVPCRSSLNSRLSADISTRLWKVELFIPIISSPMDTVTGWSMAAVMAAMGGMGIIHRYQDVEDRIYSLQQVEESINEKPGIRRNVGVAFGLDDSIGDVVNLAELANVVCLDVAHAHHDRVIEKTREVVKAIEGMDCSFMVGNIATYDAARHLIDAGANILRVGIGNGSICSTRLVTGFGIPSVTAIMQVREAAERSGWDGAIVADGGIRNSGDMAKALAAGAHAVMAGSLLAGTHEAPGDVIEFDGKQYKSYRGMASRDAQSGWKPIKSGTAPEGIATTVPFKGAVANILDELAGGIRSAFSYAGARNLTEFYENTEFVQVTQAGVVEAQTHILMKG